MNNQNQVLAAQRSATMSMPLKWEFPGGKIEPNESAEQCLIREIKEELDIDISITTALSSNTHVYPNITIRLIPFICQYIGGTIHLREHATYKWLSKNELLTLDWAEADIPIVREYFHWE